MLVPWTGFAQELKEMSAKKEIELDTSLINHCNKWEPKTHTALFASYGKSSFGPFKTSITHIDKPNEQSTSKDTHDLFWKTITTKKYRTASLEILHESIDTVRVNLFFTSAEEVREKNFLGEIFLSPNNNGSSTNTIGFTDMIIKLPGDTSLWHFVPAYMDTTINNIPRYFGKLISNADSIIIQYAVGFKDVRKLWAGVHTGLTFSKENTQVAACQYVRKNFVWLSTIADARTQLLAGTFIAVFINI